MANNKAGINLSDYPDFINDYWYHLTLVKAKSKRTAEGYLIDIRTFFRYLKYMDMNDDDVVFNKIEISDFSISTLENVTLHKIYEYIYFLHDERGNNDKTVARKISSLKSLFKYLTKQVGLLKNDPTQNLELPSLKKSLPKYLTLEESQTLLERAAESPIDSPRDFCIVTLFLNCGMRLSELVGMNITDINFNEKKVRILGKGNKERMVYLNDACINALKDYLDSRENSITDPKAVFISKKGGRISKRRVEQIVEQMLSQSGLSGRGLSVHKLRHTAATLMYQYGNVDTLTLKEILGHKSIATTEIYTHLSSDILKKAADSSPLAAFNKKAKKKTDNDE